LKIRNALVNFLHARWYSGECSAETGNN
jgi:hypothetical protein